MTDMPRPGSRLDRVARAIYERRPFVMASTVTLNGAQIGGIFEWDYAPWFYQAEIIELAEAAIAAYRTPALRMPGMSRAGCAVAGRRVADDVAPGDRA